FADSMHALQTHNHTRLLDLLKEYPCLWNSIFACLPRRSPQNHSYLHCRYYSMMTYELQVKDETFLVRFRVVPRQTKNQLAETPSLSQQDVEDFLQSGSFWDPEDSKEAKDLFEVDYREKLAKRKVLKYQMEYQMQVLPTDPI